MKATSCPPGVVSFFDFARSYIVDKGYQHEIDWCQTRTWKDQTPITFIREYTWVVLCAAFKEQAARKVQNALWKAIIEGRKDPFSIVRHPNKRKAIITVMAKTNEHFKNLQDSDDKIGYIKTLPYMGPALSHHLARNLGLDTVKPDTWLTRLADHWHCKSPLALCQGVQKWRPELRIGTIDVILWRYCNLTGKVE